LLLGSRERAKIRSALPHLAVYKGASEIALAGRAL